MKLVDLAPDQTEEQRLLLIQRQIVEWGYHPDRVSVRRNIALYCTAIGLPWRMAACDMSKPTRTWFQGDDGKSWCNICGPELLTVILRSDTSRMFQDAKATLETVLGWWQTDEPNPVFFAHSQSNHEIYDWVRFVHRWLVEGWQHRHGVAQGDYPDEARHFEANIAGYTRALGSELRLETVKLSLDGDNSLVKTWANELIQMEKEAQTVAT
jgi:hypothetical protein